MKYLLTSIVQSLKTTEIRFFKIFSSNYLQKGRKKRTVELFELLKEKGNDEYGKDIQLQIFEEQNNNSYYRVKNRLLEDLEGSLLTIYRNKEEEGKFYDCIKLANIFLGKSMPDVAVHYYMEAEKKGKLLERYDLLNGLYDLMILFASSRQDYDPAPFYQKKMAIQEKYEQAQRLNLLFANLNFRLHQSNFSKKESGVIQQLEEILNDLQMNASEKLTPSVQIKINKCARNILLQKREYAELCLYLSKTYTTFEETNVFSHKNHEEKIIMIVWLVNSFLKVKNLEKSKHFTKLLGENINLYNNEFSNKYVWLYYQCNTAHDVLDRKPESAIAALEGLSASSRYADVLSEVSIFLNLAILCYYRGDMNNSLTYFSKVVLSNEFKKLSPYLKLNISIVEIILRLETKDFQYAFNRFTEVKRKYRVDLSSTPYKDQSKFLDILKIYVSNVDAYKDKKGRKKIEAFISSYPEFEIGSNEMLHYGIWLESKMGQSTYYDTMLTRFYSSQESTAS